jgi:ethanolaminephosphotransferase
MLTTNYVPPEGEQHLRDYKYKGSEASPIYNHIISPFAQILVDRFVPAWLAPNLITLIGLICCAIPHLFIIYLFPNELTGDVPIWLCYFLAIMEGIYLILDNIDGKQARKTGNSSPMGLLFDHQCDAIQTVISGVGLFTCMQFGNNVLTLEGWIIGLFPFYFATWEEYYLGSMDLGVVNGATEGIIGILSLFLISGIFGPTIWNQDSLGTGLSNRMIMFYFFGIMSIITIAYNLHSVYKKTQSQFPKALYNTFSFFYMIISMLLAGYLSATNLLSRQMRYMMYFGGLSFAKLVGVLQTAHVAGVEYNPDRKGIWITFTLLNVNTIYGAITKHPLIDEDLLLYGLTFASLIIYGHFVYNVIRQFTSVLGIRTFVVKPVKKD